MDEDRTRGGSGGRAAWFIAPPTLLLVALDAAGIALVLAAFAQVADPDILLHVVWIVLALEAFTFGLRTAALRIAAASIFVVAYAGLADDGTGQIGLAMADLDLEEWPLMAVIAVIVAIMADRVTLTGRRYASLYRAASDRLITAQEDERKRLALDLHDGVGQTITALTLTLDAADAAIARSAIADPGPLDAVRRARQMAGIALDDVRDIAHRLRPSRLRETGLIAALRELAASAGRPIDFEADAALQRPGLLAPDTEVAAYRIVQEALSNAGRHAGARRVAISVRRVGQSLRIEVSDDGVGFDEREAGVRGLGLAGMRDRAAAAGGVLEVSSRPRAGTLVRLDVPLARSFGAAVAADTGTGDGIAGDSPDVAPAGLPAR